MQIAHIADTHIKNLKYHQDYKVVFEQLYKELRDREIDYIIHCGDIAHSKIDISPEFVQMCSGFLKNLCNIAPTYVILGNHDLNLSNKSRQDALTPVVEALSDPLLTLAKESCLIPLKEAPSGEKIVLNVLSIIDKDSWILDLDDEFINIALYHGPLCGAKTDVGYELEHEDIDIQTLKKFDYAFLGDIHKSNQSMDKLGKIRYCGSTVQQNFGELDDKGFLVWDIFDKDKYEVEHVVIKNPKPFFTVELGEHGETPSGVEIPEKCRLRVKPHPKTVKSSVDYAVKKIKEESNPETLVVTSTSTESLRQDKIYGKVEGDLRDLSVQSELIKDFLKDKAIKEDTMEEILKLNQKYDKLAKSYEEEARNVNFKVVKMSWDNLFNYGEENHLNFCPLNGVVGIFGKNFSGKSSIIDTFLLALYGSTSKMDKKNIDFINDHKESARVELELHMNGEKYTIIRDFEKIQKRKSGMMVDEAKSSIDFFKHKESGKKIGLNGSSKNETEANIRKCFGSLEDFLFSSLSSQNGSLKFISERSSRRKSVLMKFLDLLLFEKKHKLLKEDSNDLRVTLKNKAKKNYKKEIYKIEEALVLNSAELREIKNQLKKQQLIYEQCLSEKDFFLRSLDSRDNQKVREEVQLLSAKREKIINKKKSLVVEIAKCREEVESNFVFIEKITKFLGSFDYKGCIAKNKKIEDFKWKISDLDKEISSWRVKKANFVDKVELLKKVPCGDRFPSCRFIKDAWGAKKELENATKNIESLRVKKLEREKIIKSLNPKETLEHIDKYDKVLKKRTSFELLYVKNKSNIGSHEKEVEFFDKEVVSLSDRISSLRKEIINENEESENRGKKEKLDREFSIAKAKVDELLKNQIELGVKKGKFQQQLEIVKKEDRDYSRTHKEYVIFESLLSCYHSGGIPYEIIKKKLPQINEEIQSVLENVVDFKVFFENEGNKLNILLKNGEGKPRSLEMGSGAEKSIAAMAIRLSLLNVSSLPKSDLFIMDEPGTSLDPKNLEGFTRIVELIKFNFKNVFLISHMAYLKDCADSTIEISNNCGFAQVNH